jgi:hypothetical protein
MSEEAQALYWLSNLSHKQFAEFFYQAVKERRTSDFQEGRGHFVLANAEIVDNDRWAIDFIALPEAAEPWAEDVPLCQSGPCGACGADMRSWAKKAICPICGAPVGLT